MNKKITFKPYGNQAILIEWEAIISEAILADILQFKYKIEHQKEIMFNDLIVGYNSLTIKYESCFTNFDVEKELLQSIYSSKVVIERKQQFLWEIPVCYDVKFGIDLEAIALLKNTTVESIVKVHSANAYTVFFIGFLPGFLYLGGLDEQLFVDRKPNPRLKVEQGSVAIGGKQTGVYPIDSPGGWNILGKTPISFFDVTNEIPCFAKSGDQIKFYPISLEEFMQIQNQVEQNSYQLSKSLLT